MIVKSTRKFDEGRKFLLHAVRGISYMNIEQKIQDDCKKRNMKGESAIQVLDATTIQS